MNKRHKFIIIEPKLYMSVNFLNRFCPRLWVYFHRVDIKETRVSFENNVTYSNRPDHVALLAEDWATDN